MNQNQNEIVIGYFDIRGKAQVPRLLCEYSNIQYSNKFYTPQQYLQEKKRNPSFTLPYLKKGDFLAQGPETMSFFILTHSKHEYMLGKNQQDEVKVKMYCWSIDSFATFIGMNSTNKPSQNQLQKQWENNLKHKLKKYEKACSSEGEWFLGYLTLIDFSIYELVRYMDWIFPNKIKNFPNLHRIKQRISALPEIKAYQCSDQSVKEISPQKILQEISNLTMKVARKAERIKKY